ncbi:MAG TPA: SDR family oxidoreductase [Dongiaceae bacterium]|nr:SDR family oxidoreductase [Dongiaceae bacterium]
MKTILVTGATGSLGQVAVSALAAEGFAVKAASRRRFDSTLPNVQWTQFDYEDPATHQAALTGVDGIFLIAPPLDVDSPAKLCPIIDKAREMGIARIVLNSALGVDAAPEAPLRKIELHLVASGIPYTILRPNFFMENFTTGFLAGMVSQGAIYLAAADGRTSFISVKDIAAVTAKAFGGGHNGREYNLTGPEALNHDEAAQLIGRAAGRDVSYHAISEEDMIAGAIQNGLPESAAGFMAMLYAVVRNGWAAGITDDVSQVTGGQPISFAEFAKQGAGLWQRQ